MVCLKIFKFYYVDVYISVCENVYLSTTAWRGQRYCIPLELEFHTVMRDLEWMQDVNFGSSVRVAHAPNSWSTSLAPCLVFPLNIICLSGFFLHHNHHYQSNAVFYKDCQWSMPDAFSPTLSVGVSLSSMLSFMVIFLSAVHHPIIWIYHSLHSQMFNMPSELWIILLWTFLGTPPGKNTYSLMLSDLNSHFLDHLVCSGPLTVFSSTRHWQRVTLETGWVI